MSDEIYIPVEEALNMLDTLSEFLVKDYNEHAVFINRYEPYHEEILSKLVEKIKEAEDKKEEWEGFSIIKSFYKNNGKDKITVIGKVMKVKDKDKDCLEFSIEWM